MIPLVHLLDPEPWMTRGACRGDDPDKWYPTNSNPEDVSPAVIVCRRCPVRKECTTYALVNDEKYGIWGGLTLSERDSLRGSKRATA